MIYKSLKNKNYLEFDWESYSKYYSHLKKEGYSSQEQFWWHYINIGEANEYRFFNLKERYNMKENESLFDEILYAEYYHFLKKYGIVTREQLWWHYVRVGIKDKYIYFNRSYKKNHLDELAMFDEYKYLLLYPYLYEQGFQTKQELFSHYLTIGKDKDYRYCKIHDYEDFDEIESNNNNTGISKKKTIYYFIDSCIKHIIRSGIQVVTIYLARELIQKKEIDIIFVKWNSKKNALIPCHTQEIDFFFNYKESNDSLIDPIKYDNYQPIHLNTFRPLNKCIFFCPEVTFSSDQNMPNMLSEYLHSHDLKSYYILYDLIPIILPKYNFFEVDFTKYLNSCLLNADKLITISDFTKKEFDNYVIENKLNSKKIPIVKSIPLPYQYRNKKRIYPFKKDEEKEKEKEKDEEKDKITILVPGTVEFRKQQVLLLQIFNQFIQNNPTINVELILFGTITEACKSDVNNEITKSQGKIINLGIIDNELLSKYYRKASFTCFISLYEGFGFPISECLWHGVPVFTSNFGSMEEVARVGGCFMVDTRKEEEIYRGLDSLIKNPSIIANLKNEIQNMSLNTWKDYSETILRDIIKYINKK